MIDLEPLLQNITYLSPLTVGLVALAGLVVGVAPSSFPLLSVAANLSAGQKVDGIVVRPREGLWRAIGFVLGIATVDVILGALFGIAGFAVLRVLVKYLAFAYAFLAIFLLVASLALFRLIHIVIPVLSPSPRPTRGFFGSYMLGIPFGLSTCPACTPLLLPVVGAAAATGDPFMGAVLLGTFGLARGLPIVAVAIAAGALAHLRQTGRFTLWVERVGGAFMLAAALFFLYQAALYAGLLF